MTQSDTGTTLVKLRKMIESMQKEEMRQIQSTHADALAQIVSIAKQNQLNAEHIAFALSVRQPREKKVRVPRKNKKNTVASSESEVMQ
jgi:hypothetical protein